MEIKCLTSFLVLGLISTVISMPENPGQEKSKATLEGIDVSNWQAGIPLARLPGDFVIVKVTGGKSYVSPSCPCQVHGALDSRKAVGVYHFAHEKSSKGSAEEEAHWFLENTKDYRGKAIPILDWEGDNVADTTWAKTWLDIVAKEWGVKPWIYMNLNTENSYDWSNVVSAGYKLWLAQYPKGGKEAGHSPTKYWESPVAWQWTEEGEVEGWRGKVDKNVFYGNREDWNKFLSAEN